ncbi:hypothetical protein ABBQ32_008217 [Trebouxia sp. C0010 RCD-2024]
MDKHVVVREVVKHVKVRDIAAVTQAAQAAATQQDTPISRTAPALMSPPDRSLQRQDSAPSTGAGMLQSDVSQPSRSSSGMLPPTHQASMQSCNSDVLQNPLLLLPGLSPARAVSQRPDRGVHDDSMLGASKEMKAVARQIIVRCLRRWDGFLGIRASTDGTGRPSGIWKDKFDGVHYAVLLLAMRKLNEALSISGCETGSIVAAWQQGDRKRRSLLLNQLVRVLQSISEEEAQALPDKDPERQGVYDKFCSMMACNCCGH